MSGKLKPLFDRPVGSCGSHINVWRRMTKEETVCEICGTVNLELDKNSSEKYHLGNFSGRQVVAECCGKILELSFKENGRTFALAFFVEVAENPAKYRDILPWLENQLGKARKNLEK